MGLTEAIELLVSVFNDKPSAIVGTEPDEEWKQRNGYVARIRADNGTITPTFRVKYQFFESEFPILLNLAQYWTEAVFRMDVGKGVVIGGMSYIGTGIKDVYIEKVANATLEQLDSLVRVYPEKLQEEREKLKIVWDNRAMLRSALYPEGDTGEWYQVIFTAIESFADPNLSKNIELVFEIIKPVAEREWEKRESKARWTAYKNYHVLQIEEMIKMAKEKEKAKYDAQIAEIKSKWAEATTATKTQLLTAEEELRELRKQETIDAIQYGFLDEIAQAPSSPTTQIVQYTQTMIPDDLMQEKLLKIAQNRAQEFKSPIVYR